MKMKYMLLLVISAWPLSYLYGLQLGSVSFLLLAIFFAYMTVEQYKKYKQLIGNEKGREKIEKIKGNNR